MTPGRTMALGPRPKKRMVSDLGRKSADDDDDDDDSDSCNDVVQV